MNYNDFPILNNNDYQFINEQYNFQQKADRKPIIFKICIEISENINSCLQLESKYNLKIIKSIISSKQCLSKLLNNLTSSFNISLSPTRQVINFSIFSFIKKLNLISNLFVDWLKIEHKEYYKNMAIKSLNELFECLNNLTEALNESYFHFFKHM